MSKKYGLALFGSLLITFALLYLVYDYRESIAMLSPKGWVALEERNLMIKATILMLLVVIPVFILTVYIIWKFRAGNTKAEYTPDWDYSFLAEAVWWGFPMIIIVFLSLITWTSSHELDPFRPLESEKKPVTVQVVALQWKWLFIYPEHDIATVNFFQFPVDTPINFEITSDAPMNSFWLPRLGGQIYAMPGMKTKLHLIANELGEFPGSSANLSGKGFSGMTFLAKSSSQEDFEKWVQTVKQSPMTLGEDEYVNLSKPSSYHPVASYQLPKKDLFDWILMKTMMPMHAQSSAHESDHIPSHNGEAHNDRK